MMQQPERTDGVCKIYVKDVIFEMADDFMSGYALGQNEAGRGNGCGGFMDGAGSWVWILVIFALLFGWGGNSGWNGSGGAGYAGAPWATQADVRAAVDQQTLISKMDQQTYGIADATYAINNTLRDGFHGVDRGLCDMSHQISDCCCATQRAIDGVNYNMATQTAALQNTMCSNTRDIIDATNAGTRAVLDFLTTDKINTLTAENQALKFQASQSAQNAFITANQEAQTAELIRRLGRDCPVPAYVVPNPNCCYGNYVGVGYNGYNNGCGCGCG